MKVHTLKNILMQIIDCLFLLRPTVLIPVWSILIIGWITGNQNLSIQTLFSSTAHIEGTSNWYLWISLLSFSFIVGFIYVINQIYDIESDRINHKLFILSHSLISVKTAWICAIFCALAGMMICIFWLDSIMVLLYGVSLLLGVLYSVPPFELKNKAWGGMVANFLGHGVITYLVGFYAAFMHQTTGFSVLWHGLIPSMSLGFAIIAVFLTTTIPDAIGDRSTGKMTFCVVYGERLTARAAAISCAMALLFALTMPYNTWVMVIQTVVSLIFFITFAISTHKDFAFKTFRWPVFLLSALVIAFVPFYIVLLFITLSASKYYYKKRFNYDYPTLKSH
ncbi:MAG: UbiA family prenyltransferase [Chitinivibrionales bacterium]|nr:UbiA family prenyltransferase [Chitinivibrionales bacterium]